MEADDAGDEDGGVVEEVDALGDVCEADADGLEG